MARTIGRAPKVVREELRRILPEGKTDFDAHTGRDMAACMSHVNSYLRGSMGWASPMDLASALFPKGLLDAYGIERIEPREVNLTPSLVPHAITTMQLEQRHSCRYAANILPALFQFPKGRSDLVCPEVGRSP